MNLRTSAGSVLKKLAMSVSPVYVDVISKRPIVMEFTDFTSESNNSRLSPGGIGRVKGLHLSFSKEDPQQGLFLVSEALR